MSARPLHRRDNTPSLIGLLEQTAANRADMEHALGPRGRYAPPVVVSTHDAASICLAAVVVTVVSGTGFALFKVCGWMAPLLVQALKGVLA